MKVAYVMSRFPHLSETFILREMNAVEEAGVEVALYPLHRQRQKVAHHEVQAWSGRARWSPLLSRRVLMANLRELACRPRGYVSLWAAALWGNAGHVGFLARALIVIPKAVHAARSMRAEHVEHVHAHYATHPALLAWAVHRLTGLPYSVTVHAHDIFIRTAMTAQKLREADLVVAISEYNREHLRRTVGPDVARAVQVIRCGVDPDVYSAAAARRRERDELRIVSVGSLQAYKGHEHLVQCCRVLAARDVPVRCIIVGEGPQRGMLEELVERHRLGDVVTLAGARRQDEVVTALADANCYVQSSVVAPSGQMEGIPVALMEALAARLPVVATRLSGIPELVQPGVTGWLVEPGDAEAMADAVEAVWRDPTSADAVAAHGQQLVRSQYDVRRNAGRLAAAFAGNPEGE